MTNTIKVTKNHSFVVGSILYASWGYEQTNVDFYQVIKLIGKSTLELQELEQNQTTAYSDFSGKTLPIPNQFTSSSFRGRVNARGAIKIDYGVKGNHGIYARIWSGDPLYFSTYG